MTSLASDQDVQKVLQKQRLTYLDEDLLRQYESSSYKKWQHHHSPDYQLLLSKLSDKGEKRLMVLLDQVHPNDISTLDWLKKASSLFEQTISISIHPSNNISNRPSEIDKRHKLFQTKQCLFRTCCIQIAPTEGMMRDLPQAFLSYLKNPGTHIVYISYQPSDSLRGTAAWLRHHVQHNRFHVVTQAGDKNFVIWNRACIGPGELINTDFFPGYAEGDLQTSIPACGETSDRSATYTKANKLVSLLFSSEFQTRTKWTQEQVKEFWSKSVIWDDILKMQATSAETIEAAPTSNSVQQYIWQSKRIWVRDTLPTYSHWIQRLESLNLIDYDTLAIHIFPTEGAKLETPRWVTDKAAGRVASFFLLRDSDVWDYDHHFPLCYDPFGGEFIIHNTITMNSAFAERLEYLLAKWAENNKHVLWTVYNASNDDLFTCWLKSRVQSPYLTVIHIQGVLKTTMKHSQDERTVCIWKEPFEISDYAQHMETRLQQVFVDYSQGKRWTSPTPAQQALVCSIQDGFLIEYIFAILVPGWSNISSEYIGDAIIQEAMNKLNVNEYVRAQEKTGGSVTKLTNFLTSLDTLRKIHQFDLFLQYLAKADPKKHDFLLIDSNPCAIESECLWRFSMPNQAHVHVCTFLQTLYVERNGAQANTHTHIPEWVVQAIETDRMKPMWISLGNPSSQGGKFLPSLTFPDCIPNVMTWRHHPLRDACLDALCRVLKTRWLNQDLPILFTRYPEPCRSYLLPWLKQKIPDPRMVVAACSLGGDFMYWHKVPYGIDDHLWPFESHTNQDQVDGANEYLNACAQTMLEKWTPISVMSDDSQAMSGLYSLGTNDPDMEEEYNYRAMLGLEGVQSVFERNKVQTPEKHPMVTGQQVHPQQILESVHDQHGNDDPVDSETEDDSGDSSSSDDDHTSHSSSLSMDGVDLNGEEDITIYAIRHLCACDSNPSL